MTVPGSVHMCSPCLPVGYPKDSDANPVKKRKPLEEIFYREKWRGEIKAIGKGANQLRGFFMSRIFDL